MGETYVAAKQRILRELGQDGWDTRPNLKIPWAEPSDKAFKVWFKAQAVYLNEHSMFIDIRGMSTPQFIREVVSTYSHRRSY
jgi:hypothetical protein